MNTKSYVAGGELKFDMRLVSPDQLISFAHSLKSNPDGFKYSNLHVRQSGPQELCIGFLREMENPSKETWEQFKKTLFEHIESRFARKSKGGTFTGFSLSSFVDLIS